MRTAGKTGTMSPRKPHKKGNARFGDEGRLISQAPEPEPPRHRNRAREPREPSSGSRSYWLASCSNLYRYPCALMRARVSVAGNSIPEVRMEKKLSGKKVAILVTDGFEQVELTEPMKALIDAGAQPFVVSPAFGKVKGWKHGEWGDEFSVDVPLDGAKSENFDALLLPGGVMNPDRLRMDEDAVKLVRSFFEQRKPVAAICYGPWTLIDPGVVRGRRMSSWPSLKTDLKNAGAQWFDEEVIVNNGLVTSRKPADIPAFNEKMIEEFSEGRHEQQRRAG